MELRDRLAEYPRSFEAVMRVAICHDSPGFADLFWPPFDLESLRRRWIENSYPGVKFETTTRIVVIEEYAGELRYYAGGHCPNQERIYLEQDRIETEGYEMGVFPSPSDAIAFAERYLAAEQPLQEIMVARVVRWCRATTKGTE